MLKRSLKRGNMKKCIYCKMQIDESSVVDVCRRCGVGVWGEKMFNAIIQGMENRREIGDLFQGSVTNSEAPNKSKKSFTFSEQTKSALVDEPKTSEEIEVYSD